MDRFIRLSPHDGGADVFVNVDKIIVVSISLKFPKDGGAFVEFGPESGLEVKETPEQVVEKCLTVGMVPVR